MSKIEELKKLCGELRTLTEQTFDEVKSDKYSKYEDALRSFIDKYEIDHRPWGKYEVMYSSPFVKVKKIIVKPRGIFSYQYQDQIERRY